MVTRDPAWGSQHVERSNRKVQLPGLQSGVSGLQGQKAVIGQAPRQPHVAPQQTGITAQAGPGVQFSPGQTLFGQVTARDAGGNYQLRFGGNTLTAQSKVPLEVGQPLHVQVQDQKQGQLQLQVLKSPFTPMSTSDVAQALTGLKLPVSDENVGLAKTMVEHGVPLTKENFTLLKSAQAEGPQTAQLPQPARVGATWFLHSNQLPVTNQNVSVLGQFIAMNPQLGQQLFALQGELRRLMDSPQRRSREALALLAEVPGVLGEFLLEPSGRGGSGKAGRRLFDLARQAGIETHVGILAGGEQDWDLLKMMRELRAALADGAAGAGLGSALELMEGLEENLRALQLINQAKPDASLGFYYLQVPLRLERAESAEIWIRYRLKDDGGRVVDPDDLRVEFLISTEHLGDLACTLEVRDRTVHVDLGSDSDEVRAYVDGYLQVLVERIAELGWLPGRIGATLRPFQQHRPIAERRDFESLESVNVQA